MAALSSAMKDIDMPHCMNGPFPPCIMAYAKIAEERKKITGDDKFLWQSIQEFREKGMVVVQRTSVAKTLKDAMSTIKGTTELDGLVRTALSNIGDEDGHFVDTFTKESSDSAANWLGYQYDRLLKNTKDGTVDFVDVLSAKIAEAVKLYTDGDRNGAVNRLAEGSAICMAAMRLVAEETKEKEAAANE